MTNILLAIYFIILGCIQLFGLDVQPVVLGVLALIIGILLLVAPYAGRLTPVARV